MKSRREKLLIPALTLDLSPSSQSPCLLSPGSPCSPCSPSLGLQPWRRSIALSKPNPDAACVVGSEHHLLQPVLTSVCHQLQVR